MTENVLRDLLAAGVAQQRQMLSDDAALDRAFASGEINDWIRSQYKSDDSQAEESPRMDVEEVGGTEDL